MNVCVCVCVCVYSMVWDTRCTCTYSIHALFIDVRFQLPVKAVDITHQVSISALVYSTLGIGWPLKSGREGGVLERGREG